MAAYYLLILTTLLLCIFDFMQNQAIRLSVYIAYCLFLTLFVGLRAIGVDNDGAAYEEALRLAGNISWSDLLTGNYDVTMERGYLLFNKMIYVLGGNVRIVFLMMAVVTGMVNYRLIFYRSPFPFCSLFIYVCFFYYYRDFTQIRYALSAALGMYSIFYFIDKSYVKSVIVVVLASLIHGAVLIVPVLFLSYVVSRNYVLYCLLPLLGLIGSFFNPVEQLLAIGGLPPTLARYAEMDELGKGGYFLSIIAQAFIVVVLIFKDRLLMYYRKRTIDVLLIALSIASFINLLFISFAIMQRLALLLFSAVVFLMAFLFASLEMDDDDKYIALFFRIAFMALVLYYGLNMIDPALMRPYAIFDRV